MDRKLGIFETAHALSGEYDAFNVVVVLRLANGPAPEIVEAALAALKSRQPMLRARVEARGAARWFRFGEGERPIPLRLVEREHEEQWRDFVEIELNQSTDVSVEPPLRVVYLWSSRKGEGAELLLSFFHGIMDGTSAESFVDELLKLCSGVPVSELPELPTAPLPAAETLFPKRFKGVRKLLPVAGFMVRQMVDELRYRAATRRSRIPPVPDNARNRVLSIELPGELSKRLQRRARRRAVSVDWLLAAAMLRAVLRLHYREESRPLRHVCFANLRPYLRPPQSAQQLGCLIAVMRFTVPISAEEDLWDIAGRLTDQVHTSIRRGHKFVFFLTSLLMIRTIFGQRRQRMGTTAMANAGIVKIRETYGDLQVLGLHTFVSNFDVGPEFTAQTRVFGGRLVIDVVTMDGDMDRPQAEAITEEIRASLVQVIEGE